MLDDLLGAALGGTQTGGATQRPAAPAGLPQGLNAATIAALLPVLMSILGQGGNSRPGGLGGMLGQVLGGNAGGGPAAGLGGGLGGLLQQLERAGLGSQAQSWVGTGQNQPITADAVSQIFGNDGLAEIARRAGLSTGEASAGLAHLLPAVVDHVTPQGRVPAGNEIEEALGGLLKRLGG
jgi:uncharacterized protein YidB (DUF937 family)